METFIFVVIYLAIGYWVAITQTQTRGIKIVWSMLICIIIGPLWGWIAIALTHSRLPKHLRG